MKKIITYIFILILVLFSNLTLVSSQPKAVINIEELTIPEIQDAYDQGYLTASLLVSLYLERIKTYNEQYGAIISINDNALKEAEELDYERKTKGKRSLLHGIPIVIKDNIDFVTLPTTAGAQALTDLYPQQNAFIIQKLIDAGAIILAKTNMSNFAFSGSSSCSSFYTTKNAYNLEYSSYGSSGGSAVAVAANLSAIGLGTDTNSSLRGPAAVNNIVGLRPTMGLVSRTGILPYTRERDIGGPLTRTVTDLAIILDYIVGYDEKDEITKTSINKIPDSYTSYLKKGNLKGIKIGVIKDFISKNPHSNLDLLKYYDSSVNTLMQTAINDLISLEAEIIYVENFYTSKLYNLYNSCLDGYFFCSDFNNYLETLDPNNRIKSFNDLVNDGRYLYNLNGYKNYCNDNIRTQSNYQTLLKNKQKYENYIESKMLEYNVDVFAYPTLKTKPLTLKEINNPLNTNTSHVIAPTIGWPSLNVPLGFDENELPYGLQFTGKPFTEGNLIEIGYAYEQKTKHRKPPAIAPSLYEIPPLVNTLLTKLQAISNLDLNQYTLTTSSKLKNIYNEGQNYIINYNTTKQNLTSLITNLEKALNNLEKKQPKTFNYYYLLFLSIILIIIKKNYKI